MDNYLLVDASGNATEIKGGAKIGRSKTNEVVLTDPLASRHHATLYFEGDVLMIRDEGSVNGTLVNGNQITEPTPLQDQAKIQFGDEVFTLRAPLAESKTVRAPKPGQAKPGSETVQESQPSAKKSREPAVTVETTLPPVMDSDEPVGEMPAKKGNQRTILIIAVVLIVLCLCCVVVGLIFRAVSGIDFQNMFGGGVLLRNVLLL